MKIKKGDQVLIIAGKEKGKIGKVTSTVPKTSKVIVENINVVSKHKKPRSAQDKGGIFKQAAPFDASNVMVVCPSCKKASRVGYEIVDGKKVRVCKKCKTNLDKKVAKATTKKAEETKTSKVANAKKEINNQAVEKNTTEKKTTASKPAVKKTTTAKKTTTSKTVAKKTEKKD